MSEIDIENALAESLEVGGEIGMTTLNEADAALLGEAFGEVLCEHTAPLFKRIKALEARVASLEGKS